VKDQKEMANIEVVKVDLGLGVSGGRDGQGETKP
jgi:hypothetical protein